MKRYTDKKTYGKLFPLFLKKLKRYLKEDDEFHKGKLYSVRCFGFLLGQIIVIIILPSLDGFSITYYSTATSIRLHYHLLFIRLKIDA